MAYAVAIGATFGDQARFGPQAIQVVDDRQRLRKHTSVHLERGHQAAGVLGFEGRLRLLTLAQVHTHVRPRQAFEVQGDAHTVRGRAVEEAVQHQLRLRRVHLRSP
jgi:hypothetical protein